MIKPTYLDAITSVLNKIEQSKEKSIAILHTDDFFEHKDNVPISLNEEGRYFYNDIEIQYSTTQVDKGSVKVICFPLSAP